MSASQQRLALFDHLVGGGEFLLDTSSGWHRCSPGASGVFFDTSGGGRFSRGCKESSVPPIANFIDGIFTVERSAMTAGISDRDRRSKNSMQSGRQHSGGMQ